MPRLINKPKNNLFKEWHANSRVVQMVYHATTCDLEEFDKDKGDLGVHFSSLEQANNITEYRLNNPYQGGQLIIPAWIQLRNPLRLKDVGSFHADAIVDQLTTRKLISKEKAEAIKLSLDGNFRLMTAANQAIKRILKNEGYDGIIYANTDPIEGRGDSYIVFDNSQITFAITNQFRLIPENHVNDNPDPDLAVKVKHDLYMNIEQQINANHSQFSTDYQYPEWYQSKPPRFKLENKY